MRAFFLFILTTWCLLDSAAQEKRALIIGIDQYTIPGNSYQSIPNLEGCKNDALAIKSLIINRYRFNDDNIKELYDQKATRNEILNALDQLLTISKENDVVLIYYAGHGSQVVNSFSKEEDKLDESIVPADASYDSIADIRDKTLAVIINQFIDKKVVLTMILDCCHSGSMGRGYLLEMPKIRFRSIRKQSVKDSSDPVFPEKRINSRYLLISAAQENEPAQEFYGEDNLPHGVFTAALIKSISQQTEDATVMDIFKSISALIKSNGKRQEPVLAGSYERQNQPLFGKININRTNTFSVPVITLLDSIVEFQGGVILGLYPGMILTHQTSKTSVRLIESKIVNRSSGKLIHGDINQIKTGDFFEITNWVSSSAPFLIIYIPDSKISFESVKKFGELYKRIIKNESSNSDTPIRLTDPETILYYDSDNWVMVNEKNGKSIIPQLENSNINKLSNQTGVHMILPPPDQLIKKFKQLSASVNTIQIVKNPSEAHYILSGTVYQNTLSYNLVHAQALIKDSLELMPLHSQLIPLSNGSESEVKKAAGHLFNDAVGLSKIRAWLQLQSPDVSDNFPFQLEISQTNFAKFREKNTAKLGDTISIFISGNANTIENWDRSFRFTYIFIMDIKGKMTLIYPDASLGNVNNRHPKIDENGKPKLKYPILTGGIVSEPTGTDTYFLLATEEQIPDFALAFNQDPISRSVYKSQSGNGLEDLINLANPYSRGIKRPIHRNWKITKTFLKITRN